MTFDEVIWVIMRKNIIFILHFGQYKIQNLIKYSQYFIGNRNILLYYFLKNDLTIRTTLHASGVPLTLDQAIIIFNYFYLSLKLKMCMCWRKLTYSIFCLILFLDSDMRQEFSKKDFRFKIKCIHFKNWDLRYWNNCKDRSHIMCVEKATEDILDILSNV